MAPRSRAAQRRLAVRTGLLLGALPALVLWRRPGPAAAGAQEPEAAEVEAPEDPQPQDPAEPQSRLGQVLGYPLRQRHFVSGEAGKFVFSGVSKGANQWGVALGERVDNTSSPVATVQKLNGGPTTYAFKYDTDHTSFKPKLAPGMKSIRFLAAGVEGEGPSEADWSLRVSGEEGNHFSMTSDAGEVVYEGALTYERPIMEGLSALYAVDMKRRKGAKSMGADWVRNGAGLRYASKVGDFKVNMRQNPDTQGGVDVEAIYSGDLAGITLREIPGSPSVSLAAAPAPGGGLQYEGTMRVKGPTGVTGGLNVVVKDGEASVAGFTDLSASSEVRPGLALGTATRLVATPNSATLTPIEFKANADLSKLAGKFMDVGSRATAMARYKLGEDKPQLSAAAVMKAKPIGPLRVAAAARTHDGEVLGKVTAGARVKNVDASYAVDKIQGQQPHHVGQVVWPANVEVDDNGRTKPRLYGRVTQSGKDHDGKPRLQLGLMYEADAGGTKLFGASSVFDGGEQLIDDEGMPWRNGMYNQVANTAEVLRRRVASTAAEGQQWLSRRGV